MAAVAPSLDSTSTQRTLVWTATLTAGDNVTVNVDGASRVVVFSSADNTTCKVAASTGALANPPSGTFSNPTTTAAGYISQFTKKIGLAQATNSANVEVHVTYGVPH